MGKDAAAAVDGGLAAGVDDTVLTAWRGRTSAGALTLRLVCERLTLRMTLFCYLA